MLGRARRGRSRVRARMRERDEPEPTAPGGIRTVIPGDEVSDAFRQFAREGCSRLGGRELNLGVERERRQALVFGPGAGLERRDFRDRARGDGTGRRRRRNGSRRHRWNRARAIVS